MLFVSIGASAQERNVSFIFGIDPRNAIAGSEPTQNKSAFDGTFGVALKLNDHLQFGINYQYFPKIGYYDLGIEVGYILKYRERWLITPQLETKLIMRNGEMVELELKNNEFIGAKVSLNVKFKLIGNLYIGLDGGGTFRGDKMELTKKLNKSFVFDGTVEVVYIIEID